MINKEQKANYDIEYRKKKKVEKLKQYPWWNSFYNAKQRCNNSNNPRYKDYGKKGIKFKLTYEHIDSLWFRDKAHNMWINHL